MNLKVISRNVGVALLVDNWRMPTEEEILELRQNCTWTWTTQNGVKGYLVTGQKSGFTDRSIFLPAAGYHYDANYKDENNTGFYWSSSLNTRKTTDYVNYDFTTTYSFNLVAFQAYCGSDHKQRAYGLSVRPVFPKPDIGTIIIPDTTIIKIVQPNDLLKQYAHFPQKVVTDSSCGHILELRATKGGRHNGLRMQ